jgi:TPR repeat protein
MYLKGEGVTADAARAVTLFAEGARKGHAESMLFYAQCLENGTGTRADLGQATIWYQKAARAGNAEAAGWCRANGLSF